MTSMSWNTTLALALGLLVVATPAAWSQDIQTPSLKDEAALRTLAPSLPTANHNEEERTPADDLETLERRISLVYAKVAASVVLVIGSSNGVIVSPDGYVLHCHSRARPGEHSPSIHPRVRSA